MSGLLGVGGGILMTPALHILGLSMPAAVATSLTQMVGSSLSGSFKHFKQGNVSLPLALLFGVPSLIGVTLGRELMLGGALGESDLVLKILYLLLMLYICFDLLRKIKLRQMESPQSLARWARFGPQLRWAESPLKTVAIVPSLGAGMFVGLVSSLTGLGGGFLYVPAMSILAGCGIKEAIGTSLAAVFLSSVYGAIVYGIAGVSHIPAALFLMAGAVFGAQAGAIAAHRARGQRLQILFVILVLAAMASMVLKMFGWDLAASLILFGGGSGIVGMALWSVWRAPE